MFLVLFKSPAEATANLLYHGQQFSCLSLQMIQMIRWYRISRQLGRGSAEVSCIESCLALYKAAANHYRFLSCLTKPLIRSYYLERFYPTKRHLFLTFITALHRKTDDIRSVLLRSYVQVAVVHY